MEIEIIELDDKQCLDIENRLSNYDEDYIGYQLSGNVSIGLVSGGRLIAGADGCMTAFKVFYLSTLYVDENQRGKGLGRLLMQTMEEKAKALGANMIRLDTFDWQGSPFYSKLGYEQVGSYENELDGFSEYFFLKRI
jgi:predicted N-acetyltransferase YhbS